MTRTAHPTYGLRRASSIVAGALTAGAIFAFAVSPSIAQEGTEVTGGTAVWGLSTYLNSPNFGRPNPLPDAYTAPATFDEESRLTTWGDATGTVNADGSATLAFAGASVNYTSTGGGWLRFANLEVEIDADGNGVVTAEVSYGTADGEFDAEEVPAQGPERVVIVDLAGNDADAEAMDGATVWADLAGTWSAELTDFLAVGPWAYAATVTNDVEDRAPSTMTITVELAE